MKKKLLYEINSNGNNLKEVIFKMMNDDDFTLNVLGISSSLSLLRSKEYRKETLEFLDNFYKRNLEKIEKKKGIKNKEKIEKLIRLNLRIIYRLSDLEEKKEERRKFMNFILEHRDIYKSEILLWAGNLEEYKKFIEDRMGTKEYPDFKKWLYVASTIVLNNYHWYNEWLNNILLQLKEIEGDKLLVKNLVNFLGLET